MFGCATSKHHCFCRRALLSKIGEVIYHHLFWPTEKSEEKWLSGQVEITEGKMARKGFLLNLAKPFWFVISFPEYLHLHTTVKKKNTTICSKVWRRSNFTAASNLWEIGWFIWPEFTSISIDPKTNLPQTLELKPRCKGGRGLRFCEVLKKTCQREKAQLWNWTSCCNKNTT